MVRYFSRILRALLVSALGFGGGVGLLVFIVMLVLGGEPKAFKFGLEAGAIIGVLFAVVLVAVLLPLDLTARMLVAKGADRDVWETDQSRDVIAEGSIKDVVSACRQALLAVAYVKAVSDDMENLVTRASTGTSWRSAGEDMEVEINPLEENKWKLRCTSRPKSKSMLFDYGKNFENVETWHREFENTLKTHALPSDKPTKH